ncbi:ferredoxin [Lacticaseibacillus baoqingensis]|uniref:Ferredoxin n=1 Tax=Lacticaseibacillus baoqingensis TaxID=2486013 RepID=A0ABW4E8R0_9LACO|nr:ferredoxin [Lacticaseibacillus baoqingensis]
MPLYAHVDQDACIACGLCQMLAPALFDYDENGIASYRPDHNTGSLALSAQQLQAFKLAYQRCPTGAITRGQQPFAPTRPHA